MVGKGGRCAVITAHLFTYSTVHSVAWPRRITQSTIASALRPPALACDLLQQKPPLAGDRTGEPHANRAGDILLPARLREQVRV